MVWILFKFFLIYLVVVFFVGLFRTWKAVRHVQKNLRKAQQGQSQKSERSQDGIVEAEYRVLDDQNK